MRYGLRLAAQEVEIKQLRAEVVKKNTIIELLGNTLQEASDHLDYCGYGDAWERECAGDLAENIEKALKVYETRETTQEEIDR